MLVLVVPPSSTLERAARGALPSSAVVGLSLDEAVARAASVQVSLVVLSRGGEHGQAALARLRGLAVPPRVIVSVAELDGVDDVLPVDPPHLGRRLRLAHRLADAEAARATAAELESALRRALDEMRESDERFRVVARATSDAVWDLDFADDRVTWNENLAKFGWDYPSTPLSWWEEMLHPEDRQRVAAGLSRAIAAGDETWQDEYRFRRGDGSWANVLDRGVCIRDERGKPVRMIGAMMDISDRRELQARLLLADRMASVGTLAAGVAHEINNPLAYVIANIDLAAAEIQRTCGAALPLASLAEAREGAERVRRIVFDLKTFSRADDAVREPVDLRAVVESSINLAMNEIRHRAQLVRELSAVPRVRANAGRLGQVAVNLLVNAAQAIREGAADQHEIRVRTWQSPRGEAVLEVHDTGPGMTPEVKHRIFDPFYTTKPIGEGTGLGLTICHGIVAELGGRIEVESEVGAGSTFRVLLPRIEPSDRPAAPPESSTEGPRDEATLGRVLVIDDEPMIGRAVRLMLDGAHDVTTLVSAREALELLRTDPAWDAVVCDLMMPEMTGMDLHAAVQAIDPALAARFVFLTGGAFTTRAREFLERTTNPLLEKPFETDALLAAIAGARRRRA